MSSNSPDTGSGTGWSLGSGIKRLFQPYGPDRQPSALGSVGETIGSLWSSTRRLVGLAVTAPLAALEVATVVPGNIIASVGSLVSGVRNAVWHTIADRPLVGGGTQGAREAR